MKKLFISVLVLFTALLMATAALAADAPEAGFSLDWQLIINAALALAVAVLAGLRKADKRTWVDTALGLAESAQDIVDSIMSKNDTKSELGTKRTAAKVAGVKDTVARSRSS